MFLDIFMVLVTQEQEDRLRDRRGWSWCKNRYQRTNWGLRVFFMSYSNWNHVLLEIACFAGIFMVLVANKGQAEG